MFNDIGTRAGFLGGVIMIVSFISYMICYWINGSLHDTTKMTKWDIGHSIHNMAATTLIPYLVIGHRLSPYIFKQMCLKPNGDKKWLKIALYWVLMTLVAGSLAVVVFVYIHKFFFDVMLCKVI